MKYLNQIWYMASLDPLGSTRSKVENCVLSILLRGLQRGSNCNLKFLIMKLENANESGPAGIEVVRIFGPNSVRSCLGPQVVHL